MNDMEMLRQQLAEARGQAADWKAKHDRLVDKSDDGGYDMAVLSDAQKQYLAACEELIKYGRHLDTCSGHDKCDCGFFEVYTLAKEAINGEDSATV